jgi:hypothetical protein
MKANTHTISVEFLQQLRPEGPWVLTAIIPDGSTTTITARNADEVDDFVRKHDGKRNLYYSVNPTRSAMTKKAAKTDIAAVEFGLADLDPAEGETPEDAKARYLQQLETYEPRPTAVVDSGNGLQCLWRLRKQIALGKPVKANGKLAFSPKDQQQIDDVEGRVKAIMLQLGSKAGTQNIDRILRLPGTTNLPNAVKLKAGRVTCPTTLLWFETASYPLTAFPKPEPEDKKKKKALGKGLVGDPRDVASRLFPCWHPAHPTQSRQWHLGAYLCAVQSERLCRETDW